MSPTAAKAICVPSGEITGRTIPSAWRGSRRREVAHAMVYAVGARHLQGRGEVDGLHRQCPAPRLRILPSDT